MKKLILAGLVALAACTGAEGPPGPAGKNGTNGKDGQNGYSTLAYIQHFDQCPGCGDFTQTGITYVPGTLVVMYEDTNNNGQMDFTDNILGSYTVCDGEQGATGPQGPQGPQGDAGTPAANNPLATVILISPCNTPNTPDAGNNNEVFLGLADGALIAVWSDGQQNTHLDNTPNGTYRTTDNTNCVFTVTGNVPGKRTLTSNTVNYTVSWGSN
jgi:hypothetical protein